jgi:DNA-directed RNA polymerase subunit RPC12/RpoP
MKAQSSYKCPECGKLLTIQHLDDTVQLWCANGKCHSYVMNDGAECKTEAEAYASLCKTHDEIHRD